MKYLKICILAVALIFSACGNGNENAGDNKEDNDIKKETVEKKLTPDNINLEEPILVKKLDEAFFAWKDVKNVTVTGYCNFFFDEGKINDEVTLLTEAGGERDLKRYMVCKMKQEYPEEFAKTTPVTIKGEVDNFFGGKFSLINCELVSKGESPDNKVYIRYSDYKGENITLKDFYNSYFGWIDKEITVIGYYKSTTTSTTSYGKTTRVDLVSDNGSGKITVGCRMAADVITPEDINNNRDGVIIKGIIKGEAFDNVVMEECTFVNR